ncbi:MAG: DUF4340 domain-containing protein [Magnetococcales bacterium]|nr:DUF4340 domain-containing protein [Magnetococcales bacterium]
MSRGWIINLSLLLFLLAAGLGLWFADRQESKNKAQEEQTRALSALPADKVVKATLQLKGGEPVTLEKKGDKWQITAPAPMLTDQEAVGRLLAVLGRHFKQRITDKPEQPADFGLAEPESVLTLYPEQGTPTTLLLGSNAPAGGNRYLRLGNDGPVVMIAAHEVVGLTLKPQDLRPKQLGAGIEESPLANVTLVNKDGHELALQQNETGQWHTSKPFADRAANSLVRVWLDGLRHANVVNFIAGSPPEKPDWTLTLKPAKGEPVTLLVWRGEGSLLGKRPGDPDLVLLDTTTTTLLDKSPYALVDLRPLPPGVEMQRLTLNQQGKHLEAERRAKNDKKTVETDKKSATARDKSGEWPTSAWQAVEEVLLREAVGAEPVGAAVPDPPDFVITIDNKGTPLSFPFKKVADSYRLAPPDRPVLLRLTPMQSSVLDETLKILFTEAEKGEKEKVGKPEMGENKGGAAHP